MFNGDSFTQAFSAGGSGHELAQLVLKQFIVGDGDLCSSMFAKLRPTVFLPLDGLDSSSGQRYC